MLRRGFNYTVLLLLYSFHTYFGHSLLIQTIWLDEHLIWHSLAVLMVFISNVSCRTSTTELQLLNFRHWLHIVTSISPQQKNALDLKVRHCFEHAVEIIHTILFQKLLLGMLPRSCYLLCFPYGGGEKVLSQPDEEGSRDSSSLQWLQGNLYPVKVSIH